MTGKDGLSLFEIIVSVVILASIFLGISSVFLSTKKYRSHLPIGNIEQLVTAESSAVEENLKLSLTTAGANWRDIGDTTPPTGFSLVRTRVDLDGDGSYTGFEPIMVFINFE